MNEMSAEGAQRGEVSDGVTSEQICGWGEGGSVGGERREEKKMSSTLT